MNVGAATRTPPGTAMAVPGATLALLAAAAAAMLLPGAADALGWVPGGGAWRLLTSQLAHWDTDQFLWDAIAVILLGTWAEMRWPGPARSAIGLSLVAAPLLVVAAHPGLAFRGLSGIACALATAGGLCALAEARSERDRLGGAVALALVVLVIAKTAFEAATATTVFARADGWVPVPIAHAAGIACGFAAVLIPGIARKP